MELEKQLVNLELSKKMDELGVKQESLWYWVSRGHGESCFLSQETKFIYGDAPDLSESEYPVCYSAYTVAEIGEMLKNSTDITGVLPYPRVCAWELELDDISIVEETEANARAKMAIYLIENGLLNIKSI